MEGHRGDGAEDRLKKAQRLEKLHPNHREGALAIAHAATDAGKFDVARRNAEAALRMGPREDVFLVYADIEEAETGNQGRVREWLARAVRAPRDEAWVADGYVSKHWLPFSPLDGRIDVFEWKAPVEQEEPTELLDVQIAETDPVNHPSLTLDRVPAPMEETKPEKQIVANVELPTQAKAVVPEKAPVIIEADLPDDRPTKKEHARQPDDPGIDNHDDEAEKPVSLVAKQPARNGNLF